MKKLLFSITKKDLKVDQFRAGGPGGSNQNSRNTGCRVTHIESGAVGEARDSRSYEDNKRAAFRRMINSARFKMWHNEKCMDILSKETLEERVEKMLDENNLLIEVKEGGEWKSLR
jgi:protein subunit release factor A